MTVPAGAGQRLIVTAGMVPTAASGVRDYGHLLSEELGRRGAPVDEVWIADDGTRLTPAVSSSLRFLRHALSIPRNSSVVWHYSSFAYAFRGLPLPGVLFGLVLRARSVSVATVLHEPAYPWGRRGLRGRAQSMAQSLALPFVVLSSTAILVTTERRARVLRRLRPLLRAPVYTAPVFSTVAVADGDSIGKTGAGGHTLGLLGYTGDGARPDLLVRALASMPGHEIARVVVLGSPGPGSPDGQRLARLADDLGIPHLLEFTGVVPPAELSRRLQGCDVVLVLNDQGPSSRRTTVAVPMAHGLPMICLDGPDRWDALVDERAAVLVGADPHLLAAELAALLADPDERRELGARARQCYDRHSGVERVARLVTDMLSGAPPAGRITPVDGRTS